MGSNFLKILFLLSLCNGYLAIQNKNNQWEFSYNGNVTTYSTISNNIASLWGVYAKLTIQSVEKFIVAKLDDIKTIAYNGENPDYAPVSPIVAPAEAEVLSKPFTIHYNGDLVESISHHPDDILWSINIKRSIASMMQVEMKLPAVVKENHIYGLCETEYHHTKSGDTIILNKFINEDKCEGNIVTSWKNSEHSECADENTYTFTRNATREYTINKIDDEWVFKQLKCESNVTLKTMASESIYSYMTQTQVFHLLSVDKYEKAIDVSQNTVKKSLTFEHSDDLTQGRRTQIKNSTKEELVDAWYESAEKLKNEWAKKTLHNVNLESNDDHVSDLYDVMNMMNYETYSDLHLKITQENDKIKANIFSSLIPVIGTHDSIKFIKNFFKKELYSDILGMQILSSFPMYTNDPSEELLSKMEFLMDLPEANNIVKHTGILSFAYLVSDTYNSERCSKVVYDGYVQKYFKLFSETSDYRLRLVYLQGLFNMKVDPAILTPFIRNKEESHHLRSLAIYAVKQQLKADPTKAFRMFWPMVKDKSLHLDIRVAALDVIIDGPVSRENFKTILDTIQYDSDMYNQHLYNFLYTTFSGVTNETSCSDDLSNYLDLMELEEPESENVWITGKYRQGYTDSGVNHGLVAEAHVVGDPITNFISTVHFKFDRFALSLKYGTFSVYVKMQGLADTIFDKMFLNKLSNYTSVPELVTIIQKANLKPQYLENLHLEIIVYSNEKAIFAAYITPENINEYTEMLKSFVDHSEVYQTISYPLMDYTYSASDLGTPLVKKIEVKTSYAQYYKSFIKLIKQRHQNSINVRNTLLFEVSFETYNPIDDIDFGVTKYHKSESLTVFAYKWDPKTHTLSWNEYEQIDYYTMIADQFVYSYVSDLENLNKFCEECANIFIITEEEQNEDEEIIVPLEFVGKKLVITTSNCTELPKFKELMKQYYTPKSIYEGFPVAIPFILTSYMLDSMFYLVPLETCSASFRLKPAYSEPTEVTMQFNYDEVENFEVNQPLAGSEDNFTVTFIQKNNDGDLLRFWNVSLASIEVPGLHNEKFLMRVNNIFTDGTKSRFCLDTEVDYPRSHSDLYSVQPIDPTQSKVSVTWGTHDLQSKTCPKEYAVDITGVYSILHEQKELAEKATTEPFKTCKKDSLNLKYTAPTEACFEASKKVSTYRDYFTNIKVNPVPEWFQSGVETANFLFALFAEDSSESVEFSDASNINLSAVFHVVEPKLLLGFNNLQIKLELDSEDDLTDAILLSPDNHLQNDEIVELGIQSTCIITPDFVKTFTGNVIKNYESQFNVHKVGYIECLNETRFGLIFSRASDKHMAFKMWSHDDKLIASPKGKGVSLLLNDIELDKDNVEDFTINFLENDVVHIHDELVSIYYNKEYIFIKVYSVHMRSLCGICSPQEENVTV